jgi:osmotically-inducible protein OsmY
MIRTLSALTLAAPLFILGACSSYDDTSYYDERLAAARLASQDNEDQTLASNVAAALTAETRFRNADIHVSSTDDVITLSGYVDNASDIGRAEDIAMTIRGVRGVNNVLRLR